MVLQKFLLGKHDYRPIVEYFSILLEASRDDYGYTLFLTVIEFKRLAGIRQIQARRGAPMFIVCQLPVHQSCFSKQPRFICCPLSAAQTTSRFFPGEEVCGEQR
jgi:hypothetical protein